MFIVALLIVAIIVSATSIVLNFNLIAPFRQTISANAISPNGNVAITVSNENEVLNDGTR